MFKDPLKFILTMRRGILALVLVSPLALNAADHNEGGDGDLSDDPSNPTDIAIDLGDNVVRGQVSDSPFDRDIFTIQVPPDTEITSITLSRFQLLTSPSDGGMLVALEAGDQITDLNSSSALRGFAIAGVAPGTQEDDDLLDDLGGGTLDTGNWTVWIQNTGSVTDYELTFTAEAVQAPPPLPPPPQRSVQPVPVAGPFGLLLLVLGVLGLAWHARGRL